MAAAALFLALLLPAFFGGPTVGWEDSMEEGEEKEVPVPPTSSVIALTAMLPALESVDLWRRGREGWGGEGMEEMRVLIRHRTKRRSTWGKNAWDDQARAAAG